MNEEYVSPFEFIRLITEERDRIEKEYKPVDEDYALEWGLIPSAEYLDEYNWLASKLGINHRKNMFQGNVFALRLRLKNKLPALNQTTTRGK